MDQIKKPKSHKSTHYVDKQKLYDELVKYKNDLKTNKDARIPEYIGKCIYLICEGTSMRPNFNGYTYRLDMISDGIEDCIAAVKNYDPENFDNPFGYFSRIAWWAFVQRINIEKKQQYLKHKNYQNNFMINDLSNTERPTSEKLAWSEWSDQVIENFEKVHEKALTTPKKDGKVKGVKKFIASNDGEKQKEKKNVVRLKKRIPDPGNSEKPRKLAAKRSK